MRVAIGLMCKAPRPGFAKTRLAASIGDARAAALAAAFLADSAALAAGLGPATAFHAPADAAAEVAALLPTGMAMRPQVEGDLGARMMAAFQHLFSLAPHALLLGTDSPDLPSALLGEIIAALATHDAGFIPAHDGGYFAVALARPLPALFTAIPWSSADTLSATLQKARAGGLAVHLSAPWHDVDEVADLACLDLGAVPHTRAVLTPGARPSPPAPPR